MDVSTQLLSAKFLDNVQFAFIDKINSAFSIVQNYSMSILYSLIVIELVIFGLLWAFKGNNSFTNLIVKIIKIGIFISLIKYFPYILGLLINGLSFIGFKIVSTKAAIYLFNPGKIWILGFKPGISLLKESVEYGTLNISMGLIYLVLGFGILILFATIGAQIILTISAFYITAVVTLILAPFGVIKALDKMFYKSMRALIQSGIRVFVLLLILGILYSVWNALNIRSLDMSKSLVGPLMIFFSSFIFMILLYRLPTMISESVGELTFNIFDGGTTSGSVTLNQAVPATTAGISVLSASPQAFSNSPETGVQQPVSGSSLAMASTVVSGVSSSGLGSTSNITSSSTLLGGATTISGSKKTIDSSTNINNVQGVSGSVGKKK